MHKIKTQVWSVVRDGRKKKISVDHEAGDEIALDDDCGLKLESQGLIMGTEIEVREVSFMRRPGPVNPAELSLQVRQLQEQIGGLESSGPALLGPNGRPIDHALLEEVKALRARVDAMEAEKGSKEPAAVELTELTEQIEAEKPVAKRTRAKKPATK